jgi:hypothetical protein
MLIDKNSYKKSNKNNSKANTCKGEYIEWLVGNKGEFFINPIETSDIEHTLNKSGYPKYFPMDLIEDDEECEVDEWKKEHTSSIWSWVF